MKVSVVTHPVGEGESVLEFDESDVVGDGVGVVVLVHNQLLGLALLGSMADQELDSLVMNVYRAIMFKMFKDTALDINSA